MRSAKLFNFNSWVIFTSLSRSGISPSPRLLAACGGSPVPALQIRIVYATPTIKIIASINKPFIGLSRTTHFPFGQFQIQNNIAKNLSIHLAMCLPIHTNTSIPPCHFLKPFPCFCEQPISLVCKIHIITGA